MSVQPPLPDPKATIALWMSGQIAMLAFGFWVMLRREAGSGETVPFRPMPAVP